MNQETVRSRIREVGIIPAIRVSSADDAIFAAQTVSEAGIPIVEVTMTVPGALEVIQELVRSHPNLIVGAGTVCDVETARHCLKAGAHFLTGTGLDLDIVNLAIAEKVVTLPGVLTPTEVMAACKAGCDFVKVFPCTQMGGPQYIRVLRNPFPHVPMIASGGVTQQNAMEFILAGADAIGIGNDLVPHRAIERRETDWIRELVRRFTTLVKDARARLATLAPEGPAAVVR